jgi:hypothetical protein
MYYGCRYIAGLLRPRLGTGLLLSDDLDVVLRGVDRSLPPSNA